jgi:hypothetical protein
MKNSEEARHDDSSFEIRNSKSEIHWPRLYAFVIGELIVTIAIFYAFTRIFE